jgi:hypothetical protein
VRAAPPQTHQRITDLVVPNEAHGLFKCPCHAAPPLHLTGVQSCAHDVALGRVQEMPDSNQVECRVGRAEPSGI